LQGEARTEFHALREEIIRCLALVEALIDFGEGEDIEEGVFEEGLSILLFFWM
jgi:tRNA modification GTPase